jgi:hypothetical protein
MVDQCCDTGDQEQRKVACQSGEKTAKERHAGMVPWHCLSVKDEEKCALVVKSSWSAFIVSTGVWFMGIVCPAA